jgi:hypothetical protein
MRPGLSQQQIAHVCHTLASQRRTVGVREVCEALRTQFGSAGRTERVAAILKAVLASPPSEATSRRHDVTTSRPQSIPPDEATRRVLEAQEAARAATARAELAEERERAHQDLWANRYLERLEESQRQMAREYGIKEREATNRYLSLMNRVQELANRLAKYEHVGSVLHG